MPDMTPQESRKLARLFQISQIGMEMAVPVGIGVGLDYWLGTLPWFTIGGALLGPTLGFIHLMALLNPPADSPVDPKK